MTAYRIAPTIDPAANADMVKPNQVGSPNPLKCAGSSTPSSGATTRALPKPITSMARSGALPRIVAIPPMSSGARRDHLGRGQRQDRACRSRPPREQPAVTQTTWMGSRIASRIPASAGPPRKARLNTACRIEAILSNDTPLVRRDPTHQRLAGGHARHVEQCPEDAQRDEPAEIEPEHAVDHGQPGHGDGAAEVGEHTHPPLADLVDQPATDQGGQDGRQGGDGGHQTGDGRVAGPGQHQPRQHDADRRVPEQRERLGGDEQGRARRETWWPVLTWCSRPW